jgi:hypothetical protein
MDLPRRRWRKNKGHYFDLAGYEVLGAHMKQGRRGPGGSVAVQQYFLRQVCGDAAARLRIFAENTDDEGKP